MQTFLNLFKLDLNLYLMFFYTYETLVVSKEFVTVCFYFYFHCSDSSYPFSAPLLLYSGKEPVQELW